VGALLRPTVEINLLIRFLVKSPDLHTELWEAEGKRNRLTIAKEFASSQQMTERWAAFPFEVDDAPRFEAAVDRARAKALAAEVVGVGETGAVLPSILNLLKVIDEYAAFEAYTMGYRRLSWEVHGGAPALLTERFREHADGTVSYIARRGPGSDGEREFAISIFASTLRLCGRHLRLGIEDAAREVQETYVPQHPNRPLRPG
jgi:hypothetical protein